MIIDFYPDTYEKIKSLSLKESARIIKVIVLFEEFGFGLTAKHLKKITTGLWELRSGRWRILFGIINNKTYIVNLFLKKTQEIPLKEINKAIRRLKAIL